MSILITNAFTALLGTLFIVESLHGCEAEANLFNIWEIMANDVFTKVVAVILPA